MAQSDNQQSVKKTTPNLKKQNVVVQVISHQDYQLEEKKNISHFRQNEMSSLYFPLILFHTYKIHIEAN